MTATSTTEGAVPERLRSRGRSVREVVFTFSLWLSLAVGVVFLLLLLTSILVRGIPALSWDFLTSFPSRLPARAGIESAVMGSIWVIGFTALYCIPTGIMAAIYLEEYADPARWYNRLIELNIQNLAAVPAIVYGILGLGIIARGIGFGFTVLTASLTLSLLVLPIVVIAAREAIRAVPNSIRLGSYALGATKWQTIWRQVLPSAVPGMATGSILALSRAMGEAAPLVLLGAVSFVTFNPTGVLSPYTVLPIQIFNWTARPQEAFLTLAAAASIVLLVLLLAMNSLAIWLRNRYQKRW
jgi:phosphate transport system permease protein